MMNILLAAVGLGALTNIASAAPPSFQPRPFEHTLQARQSYGSTSDELTVDLGYDVYQTTTNQATGINEWLGIRFAAPPTGSLRWQAPQPPVYNRSQNIQASKFASQCPQSSFASPDLPNENGTFASEDCLFLNVYSPAGAKDLPVLGMSYFLARRYRLCANFCQ